MAKTRVQYFIGIVRIGDVQFINNEAVFFSKDFNDLSKDSVKVLTSENRIFRMFSHSMEEKETIARDESGRAIVVDGLTQYNYRDVKSAKEFIIIDMSDKERDDFMVKYILKNGLTVVDEDNNVEVFKRVVRSASQTRQAKAMMTSLDVDMVRDKIGYGKDFSFEKAVVAKIEARYGQASSSTQAIENETFTFDIMPDYEIEREHDVVIYDWKKQKLETVESFSNVYNPLDGQGTILPSAAVRTAYRLWIISRDEKNYLLGMLAIEPDVRILVKESELFAKVWAKVPSAFQVRMAFAKGLLVVYPHNLEKKDAFSNDYRSTGNVMKFWNEEKHYYDFNSDIMFTDSMWKENFDPTRINEVELEIVLWQKSKANNIVYMGYQYWQALNSELNPREYAKMRIDELKETIYENADDALHFLGMIDNLREDYEEGFSKAGGRIQKIIEILNENPAMIKEYYIQKSLRELREKYIKDMATGRIAVKGANPYIISAPELQFGHASLLNAGEYYYNQSISNYALFRSPLIHRSEAVKVSTVDVAEYHGLFNGLLIFNPFDDTLPRMGGADTDGDKVAMVEDEGIYNAVQTDLPMLYDEGFNADKEEINANTIYESDVKSITNDAPTIGEITNMSTTWKDIVQNPTMMKAMKLNEKKIDMIVSILRFMQGWAIDFAKTGFFPEVPKYVNTNKSPDWHPWSIGAVKAGVKGAEIFKSESQLGLLSRAIKKYLKSYTTKFKTVDYTFEMTAGADKAEMQRIKPIIKKLENAYRNELASIKNLKLNEEQEQDMMYHIFDKYTNAVMSIDADMATIAATAYVYTYNENGTKMKSISFPWVTAYEGLLLNASVSGADSRFKLRKAFYEGHIDNIPAQLKFYRNQSTGEDYKVSSRVPNGTYEVYKKNGQLYVKVKAKSVAQQRVNKLQRPTNTHVPFQIVGFNKQDTTAQEVIDLLKTNGSTITVKRVKDKDEVRAGIFIAGKRVASVARQFKSLLDGMMPATFKVVNTTDLQGEYLSKKDGVKPSPFLSLDTQFIDFIAKKEKKETAPVIDEEYVYVDEYSSYQEEVTVTEVDIDFDDESVYEFDENILKKINTNASYFKYTDSAEDLKIATVSVEQTGAIKAGDVCAVVTLTSTSGREIAVSVKAVEGKQFAIAGDSKLKAKIQAFILRVAHHELYRMHLATKTA